MNKQPQSLLRELKRIGRLVSFVWDTLHTLSHSQVEGRDFLRGATSKATNVKMEHHPGRLYKGVNILPRRGQRDREGLTGVCVSVH